jgi:hypothetical protein
MLAGAAAAPLILVPHRSIFLPPSMGWPHLPYASMIIPVSDKHYWDAEIATGKATYDDSTEMMSWWASPEDHAPKVYFRDGYQSPKSIAPLTPPRIIVPESNPFADDEELRIAQEESRKLADQRTAQLLAKEAERQRLHDEWREANPNAGWRDWYEYSRSFAPTNSFDSLVIV